MPDDQGAEILANEIGIEEMKEDSAKVPEPSNVPNLSETKCQESFPLGNAKSDDNGNVSASSKTDQASESSSTEEKAMANSGRKKSRRKESQNLSQIMKTLGAYVTPEEKIEALCKKFAESQDEVRRLNVVMKQNERQLQTVCREKEHVQSEHSKAVLARTRLEGLCRELQKQNRAIKDESLLKVREEEERRKEVSAKFQSTLTEISHLLQENNQKNSRLQEENQEMASKLKNLIDQYEIREQHVEKVLKHKELELQLSEAKLAKALLQNSELKDTHLKEKQRLLEDLAESHKKLGELHAQEINLRSQLNLYSGKYQEFHEALSKSNAIFQDFKTEMESMKKKMRSQERDLRTWKGKFQRGQETIVQMTEQLTGEQRRVAQLKKISRALQDDRTHLIQQLKDQGKSVPESESLLSLMKQSEEESTLTAPHDLPPMPNDLDDVERDGEAKDVTDPSISPEEETSPEGNCQPEDKDLIASSDGNEPVDTLDTEPIAFTAHTLTPLDTADETHGTQSEDMKDDLQEQSTLACLPEASCPLPDESTII
ncbi:unnamed protein product [Darwinula stevensoni]|uniref:Alpha-taxilin n=1 Tax=Darwinula stevensoni TaxID=69355 RepID=A0A7R8X5I8_9CRUS|nr:unnamed protein product [Darwinula stevensoni]CAG0880970.1 unnamed protein product [Darwinula stevensoni]